MRRRLLTSGALTTLAPAVAHASLADRLAIVDDIRNSHDVFVGATFIGVILFATTVALFHLASRRRGNQREAALTETLRETRARLDRAEMFLSVEPQLIVAWNPHSDDPDVEGDTTLISDNANGRRVLAFGSWLSPEQAQRLEANLGKLRERGEPFRIGLVALNGRHLEAEGRAVGGRAVVRFRDVSGDKLEIIRLREGYGRAMSDLDAVRAVFDVIEHPTWARDNLGQLSWVNAAYVRSVQAQNVEDVVNRQLELLESSTRVAAEAARERKVVFRAHSAAVLVEWRRNLDIFEVPQDDKSAGIAFDVSDRDRLAGELQNLMQAHARTLDQLTTAVVMFDRSKRLVFYNAAYRKLWSLDVKFLEQYPTEIDILDHLRAQGELPEHANYSDWKKKHLEASYQSNETKTENWDLPDGRALRVVTNPNPQSGVTYLFDDETAIRRLEQEFNEQKRVFHETLDALKEGVAVFGMDGLVKLNNAAFAKIWRFNPADFGDRPHIDPIAAHCAKFAPEIDQWNAIRTTIAGFHSHRTGLEQRFNCKDGSIFDSATAPLSNGSNLLTFTDVTASVNVERALTERNQALLETEQLRNDFVHHVSYELRSPLTNIIGFIQLLGEGSIGSLNPKQSEYVGYVMKSSAALLAIINDILDLATIDTGALELQMKRVDVMEMIKGATEGVQDRLVESSLRLQVVVPPDIGTFYADPKRVRQVLFNLLSNAIGFSSPGQTVTLAAIRTGEKISFKVTDQGRGIPHDMLAHVFDRFHSNVIGSRHRGVGLGLSIVKSFVELHGGEVLINSAPGVGTTVTCIFPAQDDRVVALEEVRETR